MPNAAVVSRRKACISSAQASRSQAAPSTPIRSISVTATARPTCTHSIEPIAIRAPVRAWYRAGYVVTPAFNDTNTVAVHVILPDIPFVSHERLLGRTAVTTVTVLRPAVRVAVPTSSKPAVRH